MAIIDRGAARMSRRMGRWGWFLLLWGLSVGGILLFAQILRWTMDALYGAG